MSRKVTFPRDQLDRGALSHVTNRTEHGLSESIFKAKMKIGCSKEDENIFQKS